jgi:hypothetical protein
MEGIERKEKPLLSWIHRIGDTVYLLAKKELVLFDQIHEPLIKHVGL